jgi:hypothetical protein
MDKPGIDQGLIACLVGVTEWFDCSQIPARDGVYQREVKTEPGLVYWSRYFGGVWYMLCTEAEQAEHQVDPSDYQASTDALFRWRGLAAEPTSVLLNDHVEELVKIEAAERGFVHGSRDWEEFVERTVEEKTRGIAYNDPPGSEPVTVHA